MGMMKINQKQELKLEVIPVELKVER